MIQKDIVSSQRDNSRKRRKREKPDFSRVTEVVESCQMCWISMDMQHICNRYATQIKRYIGHFSVRNYWKMSSFNYILLIAFTSSFTSKWVYTFSVNVIAPECPTIFLMIVWSVPASANIEMQVCLQQ